MYGALINRLQLADGSGQSTSFLSDSILLGCHLSVLDIHVGRRHRCHTCGIRVTKVLHCALWKLSFCHLFRCLSHPFSTKFYISRISQNRGELYNPLEDPSLPLFPFSSAISEDFTFKRILFFLHGKGILFPSRYPCYRKVPTLMCVCTNEDMNPHHIKYGKPSIRILALGMILKE